MKVAIITFRKYAIKMKEKRSPLFITITQILEYKEMSLEYHQRQSTHFESRIEQ